jgi:beta-barrel assembly-enhancing protease
MSVDDSSTEFAGLLNDGRSARAIAVTVRVVPGHLEFADGDGAVADRWPFAVLGLVRRPRRGEAVVLRGGRDGAARLTIRDPAILDRLRGAGALLAVTAPGPPGAWRRLVAWGIGAVASLALIFFVALPMLATHVAAVLPRGFEAEVGDRYAEMLTRLLADPRAGAATCTQPAGRAALDTLVAQLQAVARVDPPPVVTVIDGATMNAFALPGSRLIVMRGLIAAVEDADELAAVLAHEIAHTVHRHPTETAIRQSAASFVLGLVVGDALGVSVIGTLAGQLLAAAHSREAEAEADATGLRLLAQAGLRTDGFARFMSRLAHKEGGRGAPGVLGYFETHPPSAARAARGGDRADGAPAMSPAEWDAVRRICEPVR